MMSNHEKAIGLLRQIYKASQRCGSGLLEEYEQSLGSVLNLLKTEPASEFDLTPRILETMEWGFWAMLQWAVDDGGDPMLNCEPCYAPECPHAMECVKNMNLSPEMKTWRSLLADLRAGHIKCVRDSQTNDY